LNEFVSPGLWTLKTNALSSDEESSAVQHSYLRLLRSEGILPVDPLKEQDWSGWGQHVEFSRNEKNKIRQLLPVVGLLGRSSSAKVESVRCKRIILARKTVWCNKRFTKEMALQEVAHLHKLEHPHVVRLIGTYSLPDKLAILLYPAAEMNLEDFFKQDASSSDITTMRQNTMLWAFRCLSNAIAYIHSTITKHMDIKPQNILVRDVRSSALDHKTAWKVYIADFGIARSYPSLEASETEGPTMFTRKYAAPEVLKHDVRGLSADVFSLGCVFVEMITFLMLPKYKVGVGRLIDLLAANEHRDASYQANITVVRQFLKDLQKPVNLDFPMGTLCRIVWRMIDECPNHRPTAEQLASRLKSSERCCSHATGLEPLEAASEK
jgi:serine/threonine protein kinase